MIVREFFKTRKDGVNLFRTVDAQVDENGNALRDEKGQLIPTGYYMLQVETNIKYSEAIDVENAPYTYVTTTDKIDATEEE